MEEQKGNIAFEDKTKSFDMADEKDKKSFEMNMSPGLSGSKDQGVVAAVEPDYPQHGADAVAFGVISLIAQAAFIALFAGCVRYSNDSKVNHAGEWYPTAEEEQADLHIYTFYQDVHVMIFIGFGFLMTFLKKYGYGAIGLNMFLSALVIQWAVLNNGFWNSVWASTKDHVAGYKWQRVPMNMEAAVEGDFAAASVMITFGALIGKTSPLQMLLVALAEVCCYSINKVLLEKYLEATDIGGTMVIHMFGAYFGLACSRALMSRSAVRQVEDAVPTATTDLFSMIGTVFLWMYWPSFNSALAKTPSSQDRAVVNTLLSLCACCVTTFALSAIVRHNHKIEMVDVQNATLAGGVAIGSSANLGIYPQGAMAVGVLAGAVSTFGYRWVQPLLERTIGLHDTCGVNNLHGMPSLLGATVTAIVAASARDAVYGSQMDVVFSAGRSAVKQGGYQFAAACMTFGIAVFTGSIVGLALRPLNRKAMNHFNDEAHWEVPV